MSQVGAPLLSSPAETGQGCSGSLWGNGSPKFPGDQLLNLFGSDPSALFNFSQADHV